MSDIGKLINVEETITFIIDDVEKQLICKELSVRERENYFNKLISEVRTQHIKKINEISLHLTGKDKTDYLIGATNAMPNFDENIGALIFSNDGIRNLLRFSLKSSLNDKTIDAILDEKRNGDAITKIINIALRINNKEEVVETIKEGENPNG